MFCRSTIASVVAVMVMLLSTVAQAGVMGDYHWRRHVPTPEQEAYMARYITVSRINYPKKIQAEEALDKMRQGKLPFLEEMNKQAERNNKKGRNKEEQYSGDLGMLSYQQLEEEASIATFDIRQPPTRGADTIIGPVCTGYGCALYAVYERFRKSFFSPEWLDVETWCAEEEMELGQFLAMLDGQDMMQMVARIWPDDEVRDRKGKLGQVRADLARMKFGDPSTSMKKQNAGKKPMDKERHSALMATREDFFAKVITPEIIKEHPEVYALSLEDVVASGWVPADVLAKYGFDTKYGVSVTSSVEDNSIPQQQQPTYGDAAATPTGEESQEEYDEKDEF